MMKRSRITPILAARDPNITPALLKRKFHKGVKVEYPDLIFLYGQKKSSLPSHTRLQALW